MSNTSLKKVKIFTVSKKVYATIIKAEQKKEYNMLEEKEEIDGGYKPDGLQSIKYDREQTDYCNVAFDKMEDAKKFCAELYQLGVRSASGEEKKPYSGLITIGEETHLVEPVTKPHHSVTLTREQHGRFAALMAIQQHGEGVEQINFLSQENNNTIMFESEEKAKEYSEFLGTLGIKGGRGGNKYVAKHVRDDDRFCIILTPENLKELAKQVEFMKSVRLAQNAIIGVKPTGAKPSKEKTQSLSK